MKMKPDFQIKNVRLYNIDCMKFMRNVPDKYFELSICDPPYGIKQGGDKNFTRGKLSISKNYHSFKDDKSPEKSYFQELIRISKNQIIWGGNHFISKIPYDSSCWVVWDKDNGKNDFADCELAWTSFKTAVRIYHYRWNGMLQQNMKEKEIRIHPTQKPVALYKWLLTNYAKKGDKIFDSHGGSMSIGIACMDLGFDLDICEIDKEYFDNAVERLKNNIQEYLEF